MNTLDTEDKLLGVSHGLYLIDQEGFNYQLSSSLNMTVPDFSIKYLQKHTEYDKDENLTYHQKVRIIDQLPPKDKRIYFPNKEDRAEIRTLKSYPCCVS